MFIIVNQELRIIAASTKVLEKLGAASIYDLLRRQEEGEIKIDTAGGTIGIGDQPPLLVGNFEKVPSLLGSLLLCTPQETQAAPGILETESLIEKLPSGEKIPVTETAEEEDENLLNLLLKEEEQIPIAEEKAEEEKELPTPSEEEIPLQIHEEEQIPTSEEKAEREKELTAPSEEEIPLQIHEEEEIPTSEEKAEKEEELTAPSHEEIFFPIPEEEETEKHREPASSAAEEDVSVEPMELLAEEEEVEGIVREREAEKTSEEAPAELKAEEEFDWRSLPESFQPNLERNASRLELNLDEYRELIREFIEESRTLRGDLEASESLRSRQARTALKDATTLLQLDPLPQFLRALERCDDHERAEIIDGFYGIIDRLERDLASEELSAETTAEKTLEAKKSVGIAEVPEEALPSAAPEASKRPESVGTEEAEAFLQDVKVIPIEFSLKIAAEELNLPEDLVLEFINDFAAQGHEYLPVLIDAYRNGDLDKLQKTAHMLKGAASNLRIEPMVENLYELQFDNEISRAPKRIKLFAGQLMSLDKYLEQMNAQ